MRLNFNNLAEYFFQNEHKFNAPYSILIGEGVTRKKRKYKSISFGVARYLDAEVMYFSPSFIIVKGQGGLAYKIEGKYNSIEALKKAIDEFPA